MVFKLFSLSPFFVLSIRTPYSIKIFCEIPFYEINENGAVWVKAGWGPRIQPSRLRALQLPWWPLEDIQGNPGVEAIYVWKPRTWSHSFLQEWDGFGEAVGSILDVLMLKDIQEDPGWWDGERSLFEMVLGVWCSRGRVGLQWGRELYGLMGEKLLP